MQTMNIHFNYKRKRLRIISWYIGTIIFSLFGSVVPFVTARHQNFEFFSFSGLNYFIANEFVHLIVATILTTYFVLIIVLHERFEVLNALLRWINKIVRNILNSWNETIHIHLLFWIDKIENDFQIKIGLGLHCIRRS